MWVLLLAASLEIRTADPLINESSLKVWSIIPSLLNLAVVPTTARDGGGSIAGFHGIWKCYQCWFCQCSGPMLFVTNWIFRIYYCMCSLLVDPLSNNNYTLILGHNVYVAIIETHTDVFELWVFFMNTVFKFMYTKIGILKIFLWIWFSRSPN